MASLRIKTFDSLRSDEQFSALCARGCQERNKNSVSKPALKRRRRVPRRSEVGEGEPNYPKTPEEHYRRIFYEAWDNIIKAIKDRFDQPRYHTYRRLEDLIMKGCRSEDYAEELEFVADFYGTDVDSFQMQTQLPLMKHLLEDDLLTLSDVVRVMSGLSTAERVSFAAVSVCI